MNQRYIHRSLMALAMALAASGVAVAQTSGTTGTSPSTSTNRQPNTPPNADNDTTGQRVKPGESSQTMGTSRRDNSSMGTSDYNNMPATNAGTPDTTTTGTTGMDDSGVKIPDKGPQTKTKGKKRHHKRNASSSSTDPYQNADPTASGRPANPEMGTTSPPMPAASR